MPWRLGAFEPPVACFNKVQYWSFARKKKIALSGITKHLHIHTKHFDMTQDCEDNTLSYSFKPHHGDVFRFNIKSLQNSPKEAGSI